MADPVTLFKYGGPDSEGGRDRGDGTTSFPMYTSDAVVSTVQVFPDRRGNTLHTHKNQDGYWLVLGGRARFHGEGDVLFADVGKHEGVFVPHGTRYWFESSSDEPLEILRVSLNLPSAKSGD